MSKTVEWIKSHALLVVALLTIGSLFFPYSVLNGIHIGDYTIRLDAYRDLGSFLSGVTALITVVLVYMAYSKQSKETAIAEQQLAISRLRAYESEISEAIARKQGVLERVIIRSFKGDSAIDKVVESLNNSLRDGQPNGEGMLQKKQMLVEYYESSYQKRTLSVYHRYMYWLMKRIDSHPSLEHTGIVGHNLKRELILRMRAEMSIGEIILSLANSCTALGSGSYRDLVDRYQLHDQLLDPEFISIECADLVRLLLVESAKKHPKQSGEDSKS